MQIELYSRRGCHLCEEAHGLLQSCGLSPEVIDIDTRPELLANYNTCVPVVVVDGKVRFRGRVNPMLLQRLLKSLRD